MLSAMPGKSPPLMLAFDIPSLVIAHFSLLQLPSSWLGLHDNYPHLRVMSFVLHSTIKPIHK